MRWVPPKIGAIVTAGNDKGYAILGRIVLERDLRGDEEPAYTSQPKIKHGELGIVLSGPTPKLYAVAKMSGWHTIVADLICVLWTHGVCWMLPADLKKVT